MCWAQVHFAHKSKALMLEIWLRELSFLKLGTGVEEFLEGYQIFWSRFIGVSNISEKIVEYLMGCEIFGTYILETEVRIMHSIRTKVSFVSAMFIRQERSYLKK